MSCVCLPAACLWCILDGIVDLWLFYVILCPWGESFFSWQAAWRKHVAFLSVCQLCSLHVTHQPLWFWQLDAYFGFWKSQNSCVCIHLKRVHFECSSISFWLTERAHAAYEVYSYFCNWIYSVLIVWSIKSIQQQSGMFKVCKRLCVSVCTPTICFSPGFPELKVVARVEEQGSLYQGTLPDCVVLLMDRV